MQAAEAAGPAVLRNLLAALLARSGTRVAHSVALPWRAVAVGEGGDAVGRIRGGFLAGGCEVNC
jgi:hypothetical protein